MTELDRLHRATTRRYLRCLANGGHQPSGQCVWRAVRAVGGVVFEECKRCHVPYLDHRPRPLGVLTMQVES